MVEEIKKEINEMNEEYIQEIKNVMKKLDDNDFVKIKANKKIDKSSDIKYMDITDLLNYIEYLQQELKKAKQEKDMIEFNFDKQIKENKVDYELKLIKSNELLDKSIKTITTLEKEVNDKNERIAYLERSNDRREQTIIEYQLEEKTTLKKLKEYLKGVDSFITIKDVLDKLNELEGDDK